MDCGGGEGGGLNIDTQNSNVLLVLGWWNCLLWLGD